MILTLELGGKQRAILFGQTVFKIYKDETGKSLISLISEMDGGDFGGLSDVVYWALRVGELAQKAEKESFTTTDVSIWLDENPAAFEVCMTAFFDSVKSIKNIMEKQAASMNGEPEDGKKKKLVTLTTGT